MNQAFLIELVDRFRAQSVDVHRLTAHEMFNLTLDLRRTCRIIGTIMGRFAFVTCQRAATFRTFIDETDLITHHKTGIHIHSNNLRNDFAALFHIHHIADVQVEPFNDVGIVQRSTLHHRTCQLNRIQIGHRCYGTCTSYLISYQIQTGTSSFSLEFISNSPTGRLGGISQITLLTSRVDLQNDTIRCYGKVLTFQIPITDKLQHLFQGSTPAHDIADLETPTGSSLHIFVMTIGRKVFTQQII